MPRVQGHGRSPSSPSGLPMERLLSSLVRLSEGWAGLDPEGQQQGASLRRGSGRGREDRQGAPHQVGDDVVALLLQPHEDAGGVEATTVGQHHGAFAGHLWRGWRRA